jgi:hypothetical protein
MLINTTPSSSPFSGLGCFELIDVEVKGIVFTHPDYLLQELKIRGDYELYKKVEKYVDELIIEEELVVLGYILADRKVYVIYADYDEERGVTRIFTRSLDDVLESFL